MRDTEGNYWALVEPYWDTVDIYRGPSVFLRTFAEAPPRSQHLLAAHWCQSEVCNGGFHQFFMNSTGVLAPEAAAAFAEMERGDLAEIVRTAMAYFGSPYPREQDIRTARLADRHGKQRSEWDPFFGLDDAFYACLRRKSFEDSANVFANMPSR